MSGFVCRSISRIRESIKHTHTHIALFLHPHVQGHFSDKLVYFPSAVCRLWRQRIAVCFLRNFLVYIARSTMLAARKYPSLQSRPKITPLSLNSAKSAVGGELIVLLCYRTTRWFLFRFLFVICYATASLLNTRRPHPLQLLKKELANHLRKTIIIRLISNAYPIPY